MPLAPGTRLGPYEITASLGAGGMGEVYRARDPRLAREVAVKVLPDTLSADPDRLRRFEQEARAAGALNHPNVIAVYDVGEHGGSPYVVMELLEGQTLRELIGGRALPVRKAIEYGTQIARGLAAAHEKGIVHRDLKPENLLITRDGRAKILDFGIAKLTREEGFGDGKEGTAPTKTEPGIVVGTMGYMAPEQLRGEGVDHRADIFALGAVLYEMISGRRAFAGATLADTVSAILSHDPPMLSTLRGDIPQDIDRAIRRCLEKSPRERFQSAWDLACELERLGQVKYRAGWRVRWVVPATVGLIFASIVAVAALNLEGWSRRLLPQAHARPIRSIAVLPLENFSRSPEQEYFVDGMTEELTATLSQISSLRVTSRTSASHFKGTQKTMREIARLLGVDAVIEGSVLRAGSRVRITVELIRGATDEHLWAESYDRDLRDVLTLESEVASDVSRHVRATLTPQEKARLTASRPVSQGAYEAYAKGLYFQKGRSEANLARALQYFEKAIAEDPNYAPAYAEISECHLVLGSGYHHNPRIEYPLALKYALKALSVDSLLVSAHLSLADAEYYWRWDWRAAEGEYMRAIELSPSDATAHHYYAIFLAYMGRAREGVTQGNLARELDPLSPGTYLTLGYGYVILGEYGRAEEAYRRDLELGDPFGHHDLSWCYAVQGRWAEALYELRAFYAANGDTRAVRILSGPIPKTAEGYYRMVLGVDRDLLMRGRATSFDLATDYAALGVRDEAFEWLEKSIADFSINLPAFNVSPECAPVRSDPRYLALMHRMGLSAISS